jgi:hypothetical protein
VDPDSMLVVVSWVSQGVCALRKSLKPLRANKFDAVKGVFELYI